MSVAQEPQVPEGHPKVARRFIAGLSANRPLRPVGGLCESPVAHKSTVILSEGERENMFGQRILPSRSRRTQVARTQRCVVPQAVVVTKRRNGFSWCEMNPLRLFPVKTTRSFDSAQPAVTGKVCSPFASLRMTELENNTFAEISVGTVEIDTIRIHNSSVPLGRAGYDTVPGDKSPGYSQSSQGDSGRARNTSN